MTLIRQDSRGFIWLAAGDGLSRFDGYKFTNYTTDDGLADRRVSDLLETRSGVYWIATDAGLCRFNPKGFSKSGRKNANRAQNDESGLTIEALGLWREALNKIGANLPDVVLADIGLPGMNGIEGRQAGLNNTASDNSFFGRFAGQANTTGGVNTFVGGQAGLVNTTGGSNSFFGFAAGSSNTTGSDNNFFGQSTGQSNTAGHSNNFFGMFNGVLDTTGGFNSLFGDGAGFNNNGNYNTFMGAQAGDSQTTGDFNTMIGTLANVGVNNLTNANALPLACSGSGWRG